MKTNTNTQTSTQTGTYSEIFMELFKLDISIDSSNNKKTETITYSVSNVMKIKIVKRYKPTEVIASIVIEEKDEQDSTKDTLVYEVKKRLNPRIIILEETYSIIKNLSMLGKTVDIILDDNKLYESVEVIQNVFMTLLDKLEIPKNKLDSSNKGSHKGSHSSLKIIKRNDSIILRDQAHYLQNDKEGNIEIRHTKYTEVYVEKGLRCIITYNSDQKKIKVEIKPVNSPNNYSYKEYNKIQVEEMYSMIAVIDKMKSIVEKNRLEENVPLHFLFHKDVQYVLNGCNSITGSDNVFHLVSDEVEFDGMEYVMIGSYRHIDWIEARQMDYKRLVNPALVFYKKPKTERSTKITVDLFENEFVLNFKNYSRNDGIYSIPNIIYDKFSTLLELES